MELIETDVLIVGAGAAGLRAAVEACQNGLKVMVAAKLSPGKGTSTLMSGGGFMGCADGLGPDEHRARTLAAGRGLNQPDLVEALVSEAPWRLEELQEWGLKAVCHQGTLVATGRAPVWGEPIIDILTSRGEAQGVDFRPGLIIWRLGFENGLAGALAYSVPDGEWLTISAKALILATGGASGLFKRHDNPQRMVGDGYALGYLAGAVLQDMEFAQFYPLIMAEPDLPAYLIPPYLELVGKLYNDQEQSIHEKYGLTELPAALKARDRLSRALYTEIEIKGGKVYLDLRDVTREDWCINLFAAEFWDLFTGRCRVLERPLAICPAAHFSMGGLSIKADCSTTVPGLYACGEAAGGLHGANRHGGNALTETIVFGARAGAAAARWALGREEGAARSLARDLAGQVPAGGSGDDGPADLKKRLKEVMWQEAGIIRSRESLLKAGTELEELQVQALNLSLPPDPRKLPAVLELDLALRTARLIVGAALRREESRGAHYRTDFPRTDDLNWLKRNKVRLGSGGEEEWSLEPLERPESGA